MHQFRAHCVEPNLLFAGYISPFNDALAMRKYPIPLIMIGFMLLASGAANAPIASKVLPQWIVAANAQGVTPESAPPTAARTINTTAEQRHIIKEIVLKAPNVQKVPADIDVTVGATVPATLTVQPFPADVSTKVPQVKSHMFFVQGDKVIIVNPVDNKIAEVID